MDADRWRRISGVYHEARSRDGEARRAFLDAACGDDPELRLELELLLAEDTGAGTLLGVRASDEPARPALPSAGPAGSLAPGAVLGSYRLERPLGQGGMGAVFLAYDTTLHRQVALKVLTGADDGDASRGRLVREARNAAALNHPHICTIHEVGVAGGTAFIAMEYVEGRSLRERLEAAGQGLPVPEVVGCGIQAADALAYAHAHGVVHRDFKAANVIVTPEGRLKVVDFGLARREDALTAAATTMSSLVPAGAVAGTPYAMAPEQVRGEPADARTDVWALGVLLYELVAGAPPFTAATIPELFSSILTQTPPALPERVPVALRAAIERCLDKDPARRYQTADDVRTALEAIQAGTVAPWIAWGYRLRRRPARASAAALLALGALLLATNAGGLRDRIPGAPGEAAPLRLAVLPLENLSGDAEQEYFAAGMHDALITDLARLSGLRVTARPSAQRYRDAQMPIAEIARELNVDAVLTGSVARVGDRVRVTAQLIDGASEDHLWTDRYERAVREVLTLQNEIVAAIAREVRLQLTPEEEARLARARPVDPEAHEAYLRGMFLLNQATPDGIQKGLSLLHQAVDKDPTHPLPYAHLAAGYATLGHAPSPPPGAFERARAAALQALALDDSVALAHTVLGELILYGERTWDWPAAELAFRRAIALNPALPRAHAHYAWYLVLFDRRDEAQASMRRAQEVDPLTPLWPAWQSFLYSAADRFDDGIREAEKSLELNPNFPVGLGVLGLGYAGKGRMEEALVAARKAAALSPQQLFGLGASYAGMGQHDEARKIASEISRAGDNFGTAVIHAALGDRDEAIRWLERAYEQRDAWIPWAGGDPNLRKFRDDPRFRNLLRRMNLPT